MLNTETLALVGLERGPITAPDIVEAGLVRRFAQAIMDPDPVYWDARRAAESRYGGLVAPPLYPLYAFGPAPGAPDPFRNASSPDFDGTEENFVIRYGLPALPVAQKRYLNGGISVRLFQLARIGDRLTAFARYADIYEKEGKDGTLVFALVEARFLNQKDELLLTCEQTMIWR